jgi:serine/threonine protein kinase
MTAGENTEAQFWRDVEEAFNAVLGASADQRAAALDKECAGRPAIRQQVEALLGAHARADGFLVPLTTTDLIPSLAATDGPDPHIGRTLSHYEIQGLINRGGMGIVYRALDINLGRQVALKLLPPSLVADPERRRRFVQEARTAATLEHPHVAAVYEIGEAGDVTFIAMELIRGETLGALLSRERMRPVRALELAIEVAEGLGCAHQRGIVHRDLKPGNIMVTGDAHAKIIDFGLAKLTEPSAPAVDAGGQPTAAGLVMGTVAYMSPEQARGLRVDHRSDIFAFGIVLHEMLAGARPFSGSTDFDTLHAIVHAPAPPIEALPVDTPAVQGVLDRCLAKDPHDRYSSMTDVIADLRAPWLRLAASREHERRDQSTAPTRRLPAPLPLSDPAVEKLYLRGRAQWNKRHPDAIRQAIALFQEALEIDPLHAKSHAGLADAYLLLGFLQVIPPRDIIPKARAAALRAIELAPGMAEPHATLGYLAGLFEWDWPTARRELHEAMRLNPDYPWAPHWYGVLAAAKSLDESLTYVTLARDLDPLSPIIHTAIGIAHHLRRDYTTALRTYSQVLDTEAAFAPAHYYIGLTYERMGKYEDATANFARAAEIAGRGSLFLGALGHCYGISGQPARAREVLRELEEQQTKRHVSPYNVMLTQLGLGDIDATLECLGRALEERSGALWLAPVEPRFDGIRADRGFRDLLTRYGLEA